MWFSNLLLFLAFTNVIASVRQDVQRCRDMLNMDEVENISDMLNGEELKILCPMFRDFFSCIEDVVKSHTGYSFEELAQLNKGTRIARGAELTLNMKDVSEELCTEGSSLNTDYKADAECFGRIGDSTDVCQEEAVAAYEVFKEFTENAEELAEDEYDADGECIRLAYQSACAASIIHDECGRRAFNTYNTVVKRSTIFKNAFCSEKALQDVQTSFLDSLEIEDTQKELFRLAFDLRKRKK